MTEIVVLAIVAMYGMFVVFCVTMMAFLSGDSVRQEAIRQIVELVYRLFG